MNVPNNCFKAKMIDLLEVSNNVARISGVVIQDAVFDYEIFGEKFYKIIVSSKRKSKQEDKIPLLISERIYIPKKGENIKAYGEFRTSARWDPRDERNHKELFLFVGRIYTLGKPRKSDINEIALDAYICKDPIYRITSSGREITDIILAVNRLYDKSDYIPCIVWGRNAEYAKDLKIGENVIVLGRMQSREYIKDNETKTTYEISISQIKEK